MPTHSNYSLSDFLFRTIPSWIVHALRKVLDESYPLGNADLLLLRKLSGQSGLAGCRVVDGHVNLLLRREKKNGGGCWWLEVTENYTGRDDHWVTRDQRRCQTQQATCQWYFENTLMNNTIQGAWVCYNVHALHPHSTSAEEKRCCCSSSSSITTWLWRTSGHSPPHTDKRRSTQLHWGQPASVTS